jgi:hypothetical protein
VSIEPKVESFQVHSVQNKKTHKKLLELNWKRKISYLFQMKSSLSNSNRESWSCLRTLALHFMLAFNHNVNNFEHTQQHCNVQNENLGWLFINAHFKNLNLKVWRDLFFNSSTKLQCNATGDNEVTHSVWGARRRWAFLTYMKLCWWATKSQQTRWWHNTLNLIW